MYLTSTICTGRLTFLIIDVMYCSGGIRSNIQADQTVSKRPGTSYQIKIHFAVVNHGYLLLKLSNCL